MARQIFCRVSKYETHSIDQKYRGCRGRDRMVVVFTTTYAISAYHHKSCVHGEVY